jgi:hypothetical protein
MLKNFTYSRMFQVALVVIIGVSSLLMVWKPSGKTAKTSEVQQLLQKNVAASFNNPPAANCITVYDNIEADAHKGQSRPYCIGSASSKVFHLLAANGWNDRISSMQISSNLEVRIYEHDYQRGKSEVIFSGSSWSRDLRQANTGPSTCVGWSDCASSLEICKKPCPAAPTQPYKAKFDGKSTTEISVNPGDVTSVWVRFQNVGDRIWPAGVTKLGTISPTDPNPTGWDYDYAQDGYPNPGWPSKVRVATLSNDVSRNLPGTFSFKIKAPNTPGVYTFRVRPLVEGIQWMDGSSVVTDAIAYWTLYVGCDKVVEGICVRKNDKTYIGIVDTRNPNVRLELAFDLRGPDGSDFYRKNIFDLVNSNSSKNESKTSKYFVAINGTAFECDGRASEKDSTLYLRRRNQKEAHKYNDPGNGYSSFSYQSFPNKSVAIYSANRENPIGKEDLAKASDFSIGYGPTILVQGSTNDINFNDMNKCDGILCKSYEPFESVNRTAIGVDTRGRVFLAATLKDKGMKLKDFAEQLRVAGADRAILLDTGGSSQFASYGETSKTRLYNDIREGEPSKCLHFWESPKDESRKIINAIVAYNKTTVPQDVQNKAGCSDARIFARVNEGGNDGFLDNKNSFPCKKTGNVTELEVKEQFNLYLPLVVRQ